MKNLIIVLLFILLLNVVSAYDYSLYSIYSYSFSLIDIYDNNYIGKYGDNYIMPFMLDNYGDSYKLMVAKLSTDGIVDKKIYDRYNSFCAIQHMTENQTHFTVFCIYDNYSYLLTFRKNDLSLSNAKRLNYIFTSGDDDLIGGLHDNTFIGKIQGDSVNITKINVSSNIVSITKKDNYIYALTVDSHLIKFDSDLNIVSSKKFNFISRKLIKQDNAMILVAYDYDYEGQLNCYGIAIDYNNLQVIAPHSRKIKNCLTLTAILDNNNFVLAGRLDIDNIAKPFIIKFNEQGEVIKQKIIQPSIYPTNAKVSLLNEDNGYVMIITSDAFGMGETKFVKTDKNINIPDCQQIQDIETNIYYVEPSMTTPELEILQSEILYFSNVINEFSEYSTTISTQLMCYYGEPTPTTTTTTPTTTTTTTTTPTPTTTTIQKITKKLPKTEAGIISLIPLILSLGTLTFVASIFSLEMSIDKKEDILRIFILFIALIVSLTLSAMLFGII